MCCASRVLIRPPAPWPRWRSACVVGESTTQNYPQKRHIPPLSHLTRSVDFLVLACIPVALAEGLDLDSVAGPDPEPGSPPDLEPIPISRKRYIHPVFSHEIRILHTCRFQDVLGADRSDMAARRHT